MASDPAFCDDVTDRLTPMGLVMGKRMFGGFGVFMDGLMFGLIADDALYLKVDDGNRAALETAGMEPFSYMRKGKPASLGYWAVPADVFDDPDGLLDWARDAHAVAQRAAAGKRSRKRR